MACKNSVSGSNLHLHLHCFYMAKNYLHGLTLTHFKFVNYPYMFCDATHTLTQCINVFLENIYTYIKCKF